MGDLRTQPFTQKSSGGCMESNEICRLADIPNDWGMILKMAAPNGDELHKSKQSKNLLDERTVCIDKEIPQKFLELRENKSPNTIEELLLLRKNSKITSKPTQTFKLSPSSVLSQVKQFLPVMADANTKLQDVPASDIDIQNIENTDGPYIQMDIALGILNDSSSSEDDTSDSDSLDSDYDGDFTEKTETSIKISKQKNKAPFIEEITDRTYKSIHHCKTENTVNCDNDNMCNAGCSS